MRVVRLAGILLLFAALMVGLASSIGAIQNRMNRIRETAQLTDTTPLENAPPLVAFTTVALGGFRGLVADWLWLRAQKMEQEGNHFEMVQLASWIVKLQPRFTGASIFLSWNMAYNMSVKFNNFEDRWRWVRRGIELLRDEALVYNPGDPDLFREIGWLFQHKLGMYLDDANRYYKHEMATDMIKILGGDAIVNWERLAAAPRTERAFRDLVGTESPLWSILSRQGLDPRTLEEDFRRTGDFTPELREELTAAGLNLTVEDYLRVRWMVDAVKLDPTKLVQLRNVHGDLDFRLPEAHAVYWATLGLERWRPGDSEFKKLQCERMIFQSLANAFGGGRLVYLKDIKHLEWTPNIGIVDAVDRSYQKTLEESDDRTLAGAYENFLINAVVTLYTFGRKQKAMEYMAKGRELYDPRRWRGSLDEFAVNELAGDLTIMNYDKAQGVIQAFVLQACEALAIGDLDRAVTVEGIAARIYRKYMQDIGSTAERRGLPPYAQMKTNVVNRAKRAFPPGLRDNLIRQIEANRESVDLDDSQIPPADAAANTPAE